MKARVFEPLGMMDTRVKAYQGEVIPGSAQGYVRAEEGEWRYAEDLAASYGAGGIYTTAGDMVKWMLNYRDATLGGREVIEAITTPAVLADGDTTGYGLGLGIGEQRGRTRYTHTGGDVAHRTYFAYYPELESGVFMSSNNAGYDLSMGSTLAYTFFEDAFEPREEDEEEVAEGVQLTEEQLEAIAGDWVIEIPNSPLGIEFTAEDGTLYAEAAGQPRVRLEATSDSTFDVTGVNASVTFHIAEDGSVETGVLHQNGDAPMRRVEPVELTAEDLEDYVGRYFSEELEVFYDIYLEDGQLMARSLRVEPFELSHREGDTFGASFPFGTVAFERVDNGTITGFVASNGRTRDVFFRRW